METLKGLVIFIGIFGVLANVILSMMGRSIDKIEKIIKRQMRENEKYIN